MYTLYSLNADPDCFDVRSSLFEMSIEYREKSVVDIRVLNELKELTGGSGDVPVLYDEVEKKLFKGKEEIISYLDELFGEDRYKNIY